MSSALIGNNSNQKKGDMYKKPLTGDVLRAVCIKGKALRKENGKEGLLENKTWVRTRVPRTLGYVVEADRAHLPSRKRQAPCQPLKWEPLIVGLNSPSV